jgi:hypothetical protein
MLMAKSVVVVVATVVVVVVVNVVSVLSPQVTRLLLPLLQQQLHSQVLQQEWLEHPPPCQFRTLLKALETQLQL